MAIQKAFNAVEKIWIFDLRSFNFVCSNVSLSLMRNPHHSIGESSGFQDIYKQTGWGVFLWCTGSFSLRNSARTQSPKMCVT